ncbi:hypothetical protein ABH920_005163 [Catenulispora sp. EB89]|uniref:hypothetical protein n=1 Tax=Catenulispora sp. EB89 TaxID=3156257 RepID=UPI003519C44B
MGAGVDRHARLRYVDGLATVAPEDPAGYAAGAEVLVVQGYLPLVEAARAYSSR